MITDQAKICSESMSQTIQFGSNSLALRLENSNEDDNADMRRGSVFRRAYYEKQNSCNGFNKINMRKEDDSQELDSQQLYQDQPSRNSPQQNQKPKEIKESQICNTKTIQYFKENDTEFDQVHFSQNVEFLNNSSRSIQSSLGNENIQQKNTLQNQDKNMLHIHTNYFEENTENVTNTQYENFSQFLHKNQINLLKYNNRQIETYENSQSSQTNKSLNIHNIIIQYQKNRKETKGETENMDQTVVIYKSNFLKRIYFVLKFLKKIKFNVLFRSIGHIQNGFSDLIDDQASHFDSTKDKPYLLLKLEYILSKIQVFQQDSFGIIIWEFIQFITILLQSTWIPMNKIFHIKQQNFDDSLFQFSSIIFSFSILVRFNTSVYFQGNLAIDRKEIAKRYLKTSFMLDFSTTFILIISSYINDSTVLPLVILRLYQLPSIEKKIKTALIMRQKMFKAEYELIKLIGLLLLVAHFIACGFFYVGTTGLGEENWINKNNLQNKEWTIQYLNSIYFSVITMITIGYGDITPISPQEKIYVMSITFIGSGLFAYSINAIGEIIRSNFQEQESFLIQQQDVLNYLQKRQISKQLMLKVIKQLEYINKHEKYQRGEYALQKLNEPLQNEVKTQFYGKIIKSNKLFSKLFSTQFLNKMSLIMKDVQLYPNEVVIKKGEVSNKIFFIYRGQINQVFERDLNDHTIYALKAGSLINLRQFILQKQSDNTFKSANICTVVYCEYNQFKDLLSSFKEDHETFYKLKDILLQDISNDACQEQRCSCCNQFSHQTYKCSCLSFVPQKDVIIKRYIFPFVQTRDHSYRRKTTHNKTLQHLNEFKTSLKEFRIFKILQEQKEDIEQIFQYGDIQSLYECEDYYFYQRVPIIKNVCYEDQIKLSGIDQEEDNTFRERNNQNSLTSVEQSIIVNSQSMSIQNQKYKQQSKQEESQIETFNNKIRISSRFLSYYENIKQNNKDVTTSQETEKDYDQSPLIKNNIDQEQKKLKQNQNVDEELQNKQKNVDFGISQLNQELKLPIQSSQQLVKYQQSINKVNSPKGNNRIMIQEISNLERKINVQNQINQEDDIETLDVFVNYFDKMKEYKIYFPHNNYNLVISSFKKAYSNQQKQKQQQFKRRQSNKFRQFSKNTSTTFRNNNHLSNIS
ncbi:cation channel family protein (macronuclear) [Tetrahymena thermophila SB210]|uniref:Cation channel family protein n=1 Tax=Tetrahymena thermophila (strain SB210) TaxID=312017 RepID=Q248C6_TETTS|nr:cation channel family protein [Tetrahymena thermophila SB210]EAS04119.2 cation channel family protein [Tetrahymena thermophila SB210]|eukprot:XP_001024364.2 cation channel family protein [Tetrahymena thermophila SB210]